MQSFAGFPEGKVPSTPVPNSFYCDLLPAIDHIGELKLTLYAFWSLAQKDGAFRYLQTEELLKDSLLIQALQTKGMTPEESLQEALERATQRGTLLHATLEFPEGEKDFYFLNSAKGRAALKAIEEGTFRPNDDARGTIELRIERPNVFTLYEQNIGPLTPMIAETLRDAERQYPASWIKEAIELAVRSNVRKWTYIDAILEGWNTRGKDVRENRQDSETARRKYLEGWNDNE